MTGNDDTPKDPVAGLRDVLGDVLGVDGFDGEYPDIPAPTFWPAGSPTVVPAASATTAPVASATLVPAASWTVAVVRLTGGALVNRIRRSPAAEPPESRP